MKSFAPLSRRAFVAGSVATAACALGGLRVLNANPPPNQAVEGLATYAVGPQVWVRHANRVVTSYRAHAEQKYPYLYPLVGPVSGRSVVDETGTPWPHHRGIFFGCDVVNGVDFWSAETRPGRILSQGPKAAAAGADAIHITDETRWTKADGTVLMKDSRTITVRVKPGKHVIADWKIAWNAVEDISIRKTNHSLFSMRAALDMTPAGHGRLVNSEGDEGEKGTFGKPAAWLSFFGPRGGNGPIEGVCMMDHPSNPWAPTPWFTRDYGFASPTPLFFRDEPLRVAAGETFDLRYRVVAHAGDPAAANLDAIFTAFAGKS